MVAGTSYDDYPAAAKALPKIGDFANPSVEKIVSIKPDLVLAAGGIQAGLRASSRSSACRSTWSIRPTLDQDDGRSARTSAC